MFNIRNTVASLLISALTIFVLATPNISMAYFSSVGDGEQVGPGGNSSSTNPGSAYWMLPGKTIRENLILWGKQSGWTVVWELSKDMPVLVKANMGSTFVQALHSLQNSLRSVDVRVHIAMHHGSKTVVISSSAF